MKVKPVEAIYGLLTFLGGKELQANGILNWSTEERSQVERSTCESSASRLLEMMKGREEGEGELWGPGHCGGRRGRGGRGGRHTGEMEGQEGTAKEKRPLN